MEKSYKKRKKIFKEHLLEISSLRDRFKIFVILPASNQGTDKTFQLNQIIKPIIDQWHNAKIKIISSKKLNYNLMSNERKKNPGFDQEQVYMNVRDQYKFNFLKTIEITFKNIYEEVMAKKHEFMNYVIAFDKNHPLNNFQQNDIRQKIRHQSESNL